MLWILLLGVTLVKDCLACCILPFPSASSYSPCKLANECMQPIRNRCTTGIVFYHLQLSDEIMQSSLANGMGEKSHVACGFTLTEPVLTVAATLCAEETSDGVYASVHGCLGQQLSNEQYKVVYDFEAQVRYLCMTQVKSFNVCVSRDAC